MTPRIVVTGLGVVTPSGTGKSNFWSGLLEGKSNIQPLPWAKDSSSCCNKVCRIVSPKDTSAFECHGIDAILYALLAAREALQDSGIMSIRDAKVGLSLGTAAGHDEATFDETSCSNQFFRSSPSLSVFVADQLGLLGPVVTLPVACAAGAVAIIDGAMQLSSDRADAMLVGGTEGLSSVSFSGFSSLNVLTSDVIRPFDAERTGFLVGEGAGMLLLETFEAARKRGAHIYAELLGFGLSADAYHIIHPDPTSSGLTEAMQDAMRMARCDSERIDYVNAHGTATQANDKAECDAMRKVFRQQEDELIANSFKAVLGHTMGAAGAIETVGCILSLQHQVIPPTWNFQSRDPLCPIDCVPNVPRAKKLRRILKNSSGFGGSNSSLLIAAI